MRWKSSSIVILLLTLLLTAGCQHTREEGKQSTPTLPPVKGNPHITADGTLLPATRAQLSLPVGGRVRAVFVQAGDAVKAGDLLLQLEDEQQQAAVEQAQAQVERAQAYLRKLQAGPTQEDLAIAQAALEAAQAKLRKVRKGASQADIAAAQAELAQAQASLRRLLRGPSPHELAAAEAELANAEAALRQAQSLYDRIKSLPGAGARPEALQLERATNAYKAAKARLEALKEGPLPEEVQAARARVAAAQARLQALQDTPSEEDLALAQADVQRAEAQLAQLQAQPRAEDVTLAQADLKAAQAALRQAQIALEHTRLSAPFAGIVGNIRARAGEYVPPGTPLLQLGDTSSWVIQTTNLSELDVVHIQPNMNVTVAFDALPDVHLAGHVERIDPVGEQVRGDVLYTVLIRLEETVPHLYWGMTANVTFEASAP
ncbi:MAG: HlyD family efflux transporter periplasmic adaptor subunit [Chloroflexi bacterium]|nr:HlyD family efflux transporter periplasmic adaptor subunit [Chloroflexota bacterium]